MDKPIKKIMTFTFLMSSAFVLNSPARAVFPPGIFDGTYLPILSDAYCPRYVEAIGTDILRLRFEGNPVTQMRCDQQGELIDYRCDSFSCTATNGSGAQVSFRGFFLNLMLSSGETVSFKYYDHKFYVPNESFWKSYDGPTLSDF